MFLEVFICQAIVVAGAVKAVDRTMAKIHTVQQAVSPAGMPKHMPYMTEVRRQDSGKLRCAAMLSPRVIYIATKVECMNQRASIG